MPPNKQYLRQCNGKARREREMAKHKRTSKYAVNAAGKKCPKCPLPPLKSDQAKQLARESGSNI